MKFQIEAGAWAEALRQGCETPRGTLPVLGHVLIDAWAGKDQIRLTTTDTQQTLALRLTAAVAASGRATAEVALLKAALGGLSGPVDIGLDGGQLVLAQGRRRYRFGSLPDEFPAPDDDRAAEPFPLDPQALAAAIHQVGYAMARNDVRYYLNGLALYHGMACATDGHRLAVVPLLDDKSHRALIIPRDSVGGLLSALAWPSAAFAAGEGFIQVTGGGHRYHSRLIDGRYPEIERLTDVRDEAVAAIVLDAKQTKAAIERVKQFGQDAKSRFPAVTLRIEDGAIQAVSPSEEGIDLLEGTVAGAWPACAVCADYLIAALGAIGGQVRVEYFGEMRPFRLAGVGSETGATHIIMPVRI